jgi:alpha-glucosidase
MPWDTSSSAGFSSARPWLPLGSDHAVVNVETLSEQRTSTLNLYRALIGLRRANEALISGSLERITADGPVLRYERRNAEQSFEIILNLGHVREEATLTRGRVLISTYLDREHELVEERVSLRPSEGLIVRLE